MGQKYDREKAINYAKEWAYKRNPKYYNFDNIGGDCTSFISQCLYSGYGVMNYKKHAGWYYNSVNDRAAAWSGVEFLYKFLINNKGVGPRAIESTIQECIYGDIIQLSFDGKKFSHSLIIVDKKGNNVNNIYIASHTDDNYYKNLYLYNYKSIRYLHLI